MSTWAFPFLVSGRLCPEPCPAVPRSMARCTTGHASRYYGPRPAVPRPNAWKTDGWKHGLSPDKFFLDNGSAYKRPKNPRHPPNPRPQMICAICVPIETDLQRTWDEGETLCTSRPHTIRMGFLYFGTSSPLNISFEARPPRPPTP